MQKAFKIVLHLYRIESVFITCFAQGSCFNCSYSLFQLRLCMLLICLSGGTQEDSYLKYEEIVKAEQVK